MSGGAGKPGREIDAADLAGSDGGEGRPAWVAHGGQVYDVSASARWRGGVHMGRHRAGADLTAAIAAAPHGPEMLERVPRVGALASPSPAASQTGTPETIGPAVPEALRALLERIPFLRRHPHPMTVHFPIVFSLSAGAFNALSLLTGNPAFEEAGFFCLGAGLLFSPVAILFGYLTWWLNYGARPMRAVRIKIRLSFLLLAVTAALFAWRWAHPGALRSPFPAGPAYALGLLALWPIVSVIGWFGASLVFPLEPSARRRTPSS